MAPSSTKPAKRLARFQRQLQCHSPVVGRWLQRRALAHLAADRSPAATRILIESALVSDDAGLRNAVLEAVGQFTHQPRIDLVCAQWAESRHPVLARLLCERHWVASAPARLKVFTALKVGQLQAVTVAGPEVVDPLLEACTDADPAIAQRAQDALRRLQNPKTVDALCARWADRREPRLAEAIAEAGYVAPRHPLARVLCQLKLGQLEALIGSGPEVVEPLLSAAADRDPALAELAQAALGKLRQPDAQEAVCRMVLERDHPLARRIALTSQHLPRPAGARALFFFLTEQWPKYEQLDFDRTLLRQAYDLGDRKLRSRIAEKARRAGRTELIEVIAVGKRDRRLQEMADDEWEAALTVLGESGRWPELWQLAQAAPPCWGARLLTRLHESSWKPRPEEAAGFAKLAGLARPCAEPALTTADGSEPGGWNLGLDPRLGHLNTCQAKFPGHRNHISCLVLRASGQGLVTGSHDQTVRLWNLAEGKAGKTLWGHTDWVSCLAISPDEKLVASGGNDRSVRLWSLPEGLALGTLSGHTDEIRTLAFTLDGALLASASADKSIRLWRIPDGAPLATLAGHTDVVSCLAVHPEGGLLASGGYDRIVRLWSLPEGRLITTLKGHKGLLTSLLFAPDGRTLASASKDRTVNLWEVPAGGALRRLEGHREDVACLAVSPDGRWLASGSWDTTVHLWELATGELAQVLGATGTMDGHSSWVTCLAFDRDGRVLASAGLDATVRLWDVQRGRPIQTLEGHQDRITGLAISPDGATLVSAGWDKTICLWKSELARLCRLPTSQTTLADLEWARAAADNARLWDAEQHWLLFLFELLRWRRRHDIQLEEKASIAVGDFDIEIEG